MTVAYLGLGSNLGNRQENIKKAITLVGSLKNTTVLKVSSLIETEPAGGPPQGKFINGAMKIETLLPAAELLKAVKHIEETLGRVKTIKNGPRVIDIDILFYGDEVINKKHLTVPHPRIHERPFVQVPLSEIRD